MAAGTIFSLALSQQFDDNGDPLGGCKLYIYLAGTSTPATTYQTSALTAGTELPFPIVADASGRIPPFWMDSDLTYKARLTTAAGVLIFEYDAVPAIGPGAGGGGVDTTDPNSIASTGDVKWRPEDTTLSGWVRGNARTIGSASSGASERANADCENLFLHLWNTFPNDVCPVTGGRGGSAAADWAANKQIATFDLRGRSLFGLAGMGNTDSGRLDGVTFSYGSKTTAASLAGAALHTLTEAQLPSLTKSVSITDPGHVHGLNNEDNVLRGGGGPSVNTVGSGVTGVTITMDSATTGISGTVSFGSGSAHNNLPPLILGTFFIRL